MTQFHWMLLEGLGTFRRNPDVTVKIDKPVMKKRQKTQIQMIEKSLKYSIRMALQFILFAHFTPLRHEVIDKIVQKHKNNRLHDIHSNKMIKRQNGYFINPLSFKEIGGSDIFFVSVIEKVR